MSRKEGYLYTEDFRTAILDKKIGKMKFFKLENFKPRTIISLFPL